MKTMSNCARVLLVLVLAAVAVPSVAEPRYAVAPRERALLNDLSGFLDAKLTRGDVADLTRLLDSPDQAVSTLAATVLFRHRPAEYRDVLFDRLAVRDYDRRHRGEYIFVSQDEFLGAIQTLEQGQPGLADHRLTMLVVFLHFRDANEWFDNQGEKVALARVFRTAFLTAMLDGFRIDPLETATAIDRATRAAMGY